MVSARSKPSWRVRLRDAFSQPPTQPSLFHYIDTDHRTGFWSGLDPELRRHPLRYLTSEWRAPHTWPSLFDRVDRQAVSIGWREFLRELASPPAGPAFIPSVLGSTQGSFVDYREERIRRSRSRLAALAAHVAIIVVAITLTKWRVESLLPNEPLVFVHMTPLYEDDGRGGGGGGGNREKTPPSAGRMPETARMEAQVPDPTEPMPLVPADTAEVAAIDVPIDTTQDASLPIGDVAAPPGNYPSRGPGSGGGIGPGNGTGVGPGSGPGVGPGSDGGTGGGRRGGIRPVYVTGVHPPVALKQPLPMYTEDARKARVEGIVRIQAIVRQDGSVDSFRVLRGLGHGLDESAIHTIATEWRFRPGTSNGQPVDVQCEIEVSFRLY
jgi:protein TonB